MKNRIALLVGLMILSGCDTLQYWEHPTKSGQAAFNPDYNQCNYDANVATAGMASDDLMKGSNTYELLRQCMYLKGWYEVAKPTE